MENKNHESKKAPKDANEEDRREKKRPGGILCLQKNGSSASRQKGGRQDGHGQARQESSGKSQETNNCENQFEKDDNTQIRRNRKKNSR